MKKFLAVYIGTPAATEQSGWNELDPAARKQREVAGIKAWQEWMTANKAAILDSGGPLGKTKLTTSQGVSDTRNSLSAYVVFQAESHEAAAKLFLNHPHFMIFPGQGVEVMECLPIPGQA